MIRSKRRFIQKLNTAVLFRDAQQFCCGVLGIIFVGKIEQKHTILCLKYSTILISYLLNCCIKNTFALVFYFTILGFNNISQYYTLYCIAVWEGRNKREQTKRKTTAVSIETSFIQTDRWRYKVQYTGRRRSQWDENNILGAPNS